MPILHEIIHFHIGYYMSSEHKRNVTRHKILGKIGDISYIFELHNTFETSLSTIEHRCRLWLTFANILHIWPFCVIWLCWAINQSSQIDICRHHPAQQFVTLFFVQFNQLVIICTFWRDETILISLFEKFETKIFLLPSFNFNSYHIFENVTSFSYIPEKRWI